MRLSPPPSPRWANALLDWFCRAELQEKMRGDLEELYQDRLERMPRGVAHLLYGMDVLFLLRAQRFRQQPAYSYARGPIMWKNYLRVALRTMRRHKGFAFINLTGLAVGMACGLMILLYVQDEKAYDRYHEKADRIYRLATTVEGASYDGIAKVNGPWGPTAVQDLPAVEAMTRFVFFGQTLVERGEQRNYERGGFLTDSTVFHLFDWPLLQGNPETALVDPNSVVLTREMVQTYFGDEDPMGQTLRFDNDTEYTVTGVIDAVPTQSHFTFRYLVSMSGYTNPDHDDWVRWNQYYTYLLLKPGVPSEAVAAGFKDVLPNYMEAERASSVTPFLQPLTRIHLHSDLFREMQANGRISNVYLFSAIALFILLIAGINFMNLSTARAANRAREVGVRKAAGAPRGALVRQFLGESTLLSFIGVVLALLLIPLLLPTFNDLTGKAFTIGDFATPRFVLGLLGTALLMGLLSGSYPAAVLSAFKPVRVLKGQVSFGGNAGLRKGLVVFQFVVSSGLIMATGIMLEQLDYMRSKPLGFEKEQIVTLNIRDDAMREAIDAVKQQFAVHPNVVSVSVSGNTPGGGDWGLPFQVEGLADEERPPMRTLVVDHDFVETYGMEMAEGRGFSRDYPTDATQAVLINEEAVRQLGWEQPVGQAITVPFLEREMNVVGVLKDFHFRSLHEQVGPIMLFIPPDGWFSYFSIKVRGEQMEETLAHLEKVWATFDPSHPFTYTFFDQQYDQLHQADERLGTLLGYFTLLAVLIACLGLFGMASFTAQQRTKEVGVRKVMGATVPGLLVLFTKDFTGLVLIALVPAALLAYFAMDRWLTSFAYHVDIRPTTFLLSGLLALGIALLTVSYQAVRAARANPVDALRYE